MRYRLVWQRRLNLRFEISLASRPRSRSRPPATGKTYRGKAGDNFDEFNRQSGAAMGKVRVPPSDAEIETFFTCWQHSIPQARKYLPAARDYFAASLWRRLGLRINETVMLDIRDWRPDLGGFGKLHVRFGKGARGRGPQPRLVPAINGTAELIDWWLGEVRHQYGED